MITLLTSTGAAQKLLQADLYTLTLADSTVLRYTSADRDITISGVTWAQGPLFKRGSTSYKLGTEASSLQVTITPRSADQLASLAWLQAASNGALDGATMLIERFITDNWADTSRGKIYHFFGLCGAVDMDRMSATITLNSPAILLNQQYPKNLFQVTCINTLYDSACTVNKAAKTVAGAALAGGSASTFGTNLVQADSYFNLGVIKFTSGQNSGASRAVDSYLLASGQVSVAYPFSYAPAAGDTFNIYPGCNKLFTGDCLGKFANQANFKGHPFIPVAETAF